MLNVDSALKTIYKNNQFPYCTEKADIQLQVIFSNLNLTIGNDQIVTGTFSLEQSICSDNDLTFGSCEASTVKFTVADVDDELKDEVFTVKHIVNNTYELILGVFTVDSCKKQGDKRFKDIVAYDNMVKFDIDVADWYNSLNFTGMTLKSFRESLCTYCGVLYEDSSLPNDSMPVEKTISPESISGRTMLFYCEEMNGAFGHIGRDGKLQHIVLNPNNGLYPDVSLYPDTELYPCLQNDYSGQADEDISIYKEVDFEEYEVSEIDKLQIRQEDGDIGGIAGTGTNIYYITGNILAFGKSSYDLNNIANNIIGNMMNRKYRPFSSSSLGLPYVDVGDVISFDTLDVTSYIMKRVINGVQNVTDSYSASGSKEREFSVSTNQEITQLKGKTAVLTRNVETLSNTLTDVENNLTSSITQTAESVSTEVSRATTAEASLQSSITQTAESITSEVTRATTSEENLSSRITQNANSIILKVSQGQVSSSLSVEHDQITITGDRFVLSATNCSITAAGKITASEADFTGGTITGAKFISVATSHRTEIDGGIITSSFARFYQPTSYGFNTGYGVEITYGDIQVYNGSYMTYIGPSHITTPTLNVTNLSISSSISVPYVSATYSVSAQTVSASSQLFVNNINVYSALQDLSGRISNLGG